MEPVAEFVVPVRRWPAYLLTCLAPVLLVLNTVLVALLLAGRSGAPDALFVSSLAVVIVGALVELAAVGWVLHRVWQMILHPPRLSAQGMLVWLFATSAYVAVPWSRIIAVRTGTRGIARYLLVEVHQPEELAGGDPRSLRKIRRLLRRFGGPFLYDLPSSPAGLRAVDQAVRWFSGGRLALEAPRHLPRARSR